MMRTDSPAAYGILNPSRLVRKDADGNRVIIVNASPNRVGVSIDDMYDLERAGALRIATMHYPREAIDYGQIEVSYFVL